MNLNERDLIQSCKTGDLIRVKHLIEKEDANLNIRDKWDSTPLYYACLCGHIEVVQYLLTNGAKCEANTFDGERCRYGSLTDQIRNVLRNSKVNTAKLDQYDLFLEKLFEKGELADFIFEVNGSVFKAHKCVLACRSEYFRIKFETKWKNRNYATGSSELLLPDAFDAVLKYIYTGRFSTYKAYFKSCLRLVRLFKLQNLLQIFEKMALIPLKDDMEQPMLLDNTDIFLMGKFGANSKLTEMITIEPDKDDLVERIDGQKMNQINVDFSHLAHCCLPNDLRNNSYSNKPDLISTSDIRIKVEDTYFFNAHKAFLVERCDFFKAFLSDPFNEIKETNEVSEIELKEMTKEVLVEIIYFLYSNNLSSNHLDEYLLNELLFFADFYMLPGLKRKCAQELIASHLNKKNIFDLLKKARMFDLKKMQFSCISFLAENLFEFENNEQLKEIIVADAAVLQDRQATDSIDIIDDLRYAINDKAFKHNNSGDYLLEREKKLYLIDKILGELNLEC